MQDLRYPIGPYVREDQVTDKRRREWIGEIAAVPARLRDAVAGLGDGQLDTPYRGGGWTVRQVVHHVPDSHMNAFVRFKLTLTEDVPTVKPYLEARWAELPDAKGPIENSLVLLDALHARWITLLNELAPADYERQLRHPEHERLMNLDDLLGLYAWHGRHHTAHITSLRERMGW